MQDLFETANTHPQFRKFRISDVLFTEYKCLAEASVFDIWSQHNYFVYVLGGKKQWSTPQADYMIYEGELIFVKKGANIIHKFFEEQFCALMIFMPDDYIREVVQPHPQVFSGLKEQETDSVFPVSLDNTLHAYFQSLSSYFFSDQAPSEILLEIKFRELLLNLISSVLHNGLSSYFKSLFYNTRTPIPSIMEANFTYNLSLEEFARLSNRSLSAFKAEFKEIYSCSPGRWLTQKRLEHAKKLLINSDKAITDLAFECGFENASHFSRVFREKFGVTPLRSRSAF